MDEKFIYQLGQRDTFAFILASYKNKIKLPELAEEYLKSTGEKHFSHQWHISK